MLNTIPATAEAATAQTADADAIQAAMRPLAGFGAGAFACAGAWAGSLSASSLSASPLSASPLISEMAYMAGDRDVVQVDSVQQDTHNFIQTARLYPVTKGGVGPHPEREPEPV